jgi:FkbM family methyltransferase
MNYETENLDFIDHIPEGSTMYDFGACEGRFSIYAAKRNIRVFAFEPDEYNFLVFTENIKLNNLENKITTYKLAVGNKNNTAIMKIGQPWPGGHQKVVQFDNYERLDLNFDYELESTIQIIALDEFIKEHQLPMPDFIKIDIDGSELPFLDGARKTLSNSTLKGIIFELCLNDSKFDYIIEKLKNAGFIEKSRHKIPNEDVLYNFIFERNN